MVEELEQLRECELERSDVIYKYIQTKTALTGTYYNDCDLWHLKPQASEQKDRFTTHEHAFRARERTTCEYSVELHHPTLDIPPTAIQRVSNIRIPVSGFNDFGDARMLSPKDFQ